MTHTTETDHYHTAGNISDDDYKVHNRANDPRVNHHFQFDMDPFIKPCGVVLTKRDHPRCQRYICMIMDFCIMIIKKHSIH